ncbi:MAG: hypothetical protein CMI79_01705 [Candidatus Pelagibacter sp.]|nr:hypothetical protein [Candidatus Pelagibacter sp.]|tara:strand:- start:556 stop:1272 length:717 start_codon:yes stop_codon:yes gene_type:complete
MTDDKIVITQVPNLTDVNVDVNTSASSIKDNLSKVASSMTTTVKESVSEVSSQQSSGFNMWTIIKYILIVLILAFLGFNIFSALGKGVDSTKGFLGPLLQSLGFGVGETVKQTVNTAADGTNVVVDVAAGTLDDAVTLMQKSVGVKDVQFNRIDDPNTSTQEVLDKAAKKQKQQKVQEPEPDDATSRTQVDPGARKAGFCYIGEDRGFRSCIKVGEGDQCMSGDIFPTRDICINPSLR